VERRLRDVLWRVVHQSWLIVGLCAGIVVGVVIGLGFRVNYFASVWWICVVVGLFVLVYIRPRLLLVALIFIAGMVLAFFRVATELRGQDYIRQFYGMEVMMTGVVDGDPEEDEGEIKMKLNELKFGEEERVVDGSIFVTAKVNVDIRDDRDAVVQRDDTVVLEGKMLEGFGTYVGYMYRPTIRRVMRPEPGSWVLRVRNWFAERIERLVPEPEVKLGLSYLLGMKAGLSDELSEYLRVVGLTHIVVASGAHLSILVEVARRIFGRLSRFAGLLFSVVFVIFFMAMVGWTPSIMRAGVMAILTLVSWYVGRRIAAWRLILMVAALTLMMEPSFVINLGWLLSFASYAGIMMLGPAMMKFFYGARKPGFVGSTVLTTVAATMMTLPIVLYFYGAVSLISVAANLLILPTLSVAMGLVFLVGVVAGVPLVETVVSWSATRVLDFHILVVGWLGEMRQFLVKIELYQWWVFALYLIILVPLIGLTWRKVVKWRKGKYQFNFEE